MKFQSGDLKASSLSQGLHSNGIFQVKFQKEVLIHETIYKKTCHSLPILPLWLRMFVAGSQVLFKEAHCWQNSLSLVVQQSQSLASFVRPCTGCICFHNLLIKVSSGALIEILYGRKATSCVLMASLLCSRSTGTCMCQ